jgi:hypothetical protein
MTIEDKIRAALLVGGDTLTLEDMRELALARRVQWWGDEHAALGTEVLTYPRRKVLNVFMAAGELRAILALQDPVDVFARDNGCTHMIAHGRPAWGLAGRPLGWMPINIQYVREVPP